jgi:hypothetical protein
MMNHDGLVSHATTLADSVNALPASRLWVTARTRASVGAISGAMFCKTPSVV